MIGRLIGEVAHVAEDHVLLDVGGVGYVVHCSSRTLGGLPPVGSPARLFTDLVVREDLMQLFGFPSMLEREWHRLLVTVQGVGARVSVGILGTLGPDGVQRAIATGDQASIRRAPQVGPKLATRIVTELKAKAPAMMAVAGAEAKTAPPPGAPQVTEAPDADPVAAADALSALVNLGYQQGEAAEAVARAHGEAPDADSGTLIKAALKALAPAG